MRRDKRTGGSGPDSFCLVLPEFLEPALRAQHPWIYRDHVPRDRHFDDGSWVKVRSGRTEAWALWDSESAIALRVFSLVECPDERWFRERVREAVSLRKATLRDDTTAYRVLYGEGDGLPGLTADRYDRWVVVVSYSSALDAIVPVVARILAEELGLEGVLWRPSSAERGAPLVLLLGSQPPHDLTILEHGHGYYADLGTGQKTGLFLDQRDNRETVARYAVGGSLLNLFSYTGGFSVAAALAGATRVTSVDIAGPAMQRAKDNFRLNGLPLEGHEFLVEDCYDYLARTETDGRVFDVVVCDPPSLARNRAQLPAALRAYTQLNARALSRVRLGGFYAAASCTAQLGPEAFRAMLGDATRQARRRLQILHEVGHAPDHPHFVAHPEGRYLKFILGRVLGNA